MDGLRTLLRLGRPMDTRARVLLATVIAGLLPLTGGSIAATPPAQPPADVPGAAATPLGDRVAPTSIPDAPNIIYIIGDDLGFNHHGFLGDPIAHTPNLDQLARGGTVFTTAYATASVCNPSLKSLLTGDEPIRRSSGPKIRRASTATLPGMLAQRGYASFQAGKLWQKSSAEAGFTQGTKSGVQDSPELISWMGGGPALTIGRTTMEPIFEFIEAHKKQPFFLWFAPLLPHQPWDAPEAYRRIYRDRNPPLSKATVAYYANVTWLDAVIGQLVEFLDKEDLRSKTLLVFLNDNGFGPRPEDNLAGKAWQGAKGTTSELGFRTPLVFNWPGHVPAGVVRDDLVSLLDLFPTSLGYAGVPTPSDRPGLDLRTAIAGERGPREEIIGRMNAVRILDPQNLPPSKKTTAYFLRDDRWHYVWSPRENVELLFDIVTDPDEQLNVVSENPDTARALRARVQDWIENDPGPPARQATRPAPTEAPSRKSAAATASPPP